MIIFASEAVAVVSLLRFVIWRVPSLNIDPPQRRAALYDKKAAVIEVTPQLGGTCVNVGK